MRPLYQLLLATLISGLSLTAQAGGNAAAGQAIAKAKCAMCHGADGNSTSDQFPRLAGQYPDYIEQALTEYKSGARQNPIMKGFAGGLSEQDIKDVAAWFSSQTGLITPERPRAVSDL